MAGLGWQELMIVLVIIVIIFGAGKLPEVGSSLGRGIKEFKKETSAPDGSIGSGPATAQRRDDGKIVETREMRAEEI